MEERLVAALGKGNKKEGKTIGRVAVPPPEAERPEAHGALAGGEADGRGDAHALRVPM
jgi:hypothetical protein